MRQQQTGRDEARASPHRAGLLSRNRFRLPRIRDRIGMIPMEPGSLLMERKMLQGIKQRAERLHREQAAAPAG